MSGRVQTNVRCPGCRHRLDKHHQFMGPRPGEPDEGSIGICMYCGELYRFSASGAVLLDADEWRAFMSVPAIGGMVANIQALNRLLGEGWR